MSLTVALRTFVVVIAIGASYVLIDAKAADSACDDANLQIFYSTGGFKPLSGLEPAIDDVRRDCDGAFGLLRAAEVVRHASERRPSLAPVAVDLAREGTEREPDNYAAWLTLAAALEPVTPAEVPAAVEKAKELNPRLQVPEAIRR